MYFVFYKLKAEENIREILEIGKQFNLKIIFIPREETDIDYYKLKEKYNFEILHYDNLLEIFKDKKIAFIETYGNKFIHEVNLKDYDIFVFGSEDKGIDICDIKKAKNYEILKIPIKKESYNVVSSFVMLLTEMKIQNLL